MTMGPVAILGGSGRQGSGLARRLAAAGVSVIVGSRDPQRARATFPIASSSNTIEVADNASAASSADTVVLAVPFDAVDALLDEIASRLNRDAIVIDLTVPLSFAGGRMTMIDVAEGSAAEHIRTRLLSAVPPPSPLNT